VKCFISTLTLGGAVGLQGKYAGQTERTERVQVLLLLGRLLAAGPARRDRDGVDGRGWSGKQGAGWHGRSGRRATEKGAVTPTKTSSLPGTSTASPVNLSTLFRTGHLISQPMFILFDVK
jgi:hypothetical protein